MPHFLCAARDEAVRTGVEILQDHFDFTVHHALSIESIDALLAQFSPDIALCDFDISPKDVLMLPARHPKTSWILRMPPETGWALAGELGISSGFADILPAQMSMGNLCEAIACCLDWREAAKDAAPSGRNAETPPGAGGGAESRILPFKGPGICHAIAAEQEQMCGKSAAHALTSLAPESGKGRLCTSLMRTPWLSILYRIYKEKASGVVHLRRKFTHWAIDFNGGYPISADMRALDDALGFEAWYKRRGDDAHIDAKLPSNRFLRPKDLPKPDPKLFERRRAYLTAVVDDVFVWPDARAEFIPHAERPTAADDPVFSPHDIEKIVIDAALFRIPGAMIHEVTHSDLSYFLKLKDNASDFLGGILPPKAQTVVDRLRSGSRLSEMLAMLPDTCPVQRVVYLAAMTDGLNRLS